MAAASKAFLAIDLGASSGRHVVGQLDGRRLRLSEVHRFGNGPVEASGHLYWDVLRLWSHIRQGLRAAAAEHGRHLVSVGVDTWGVDFGLLSANDELLANPYHYRDPHTEAAYEQALATVSRERIFSRSGVQFMRFNSLYQLMAMRMARSPLLDCAQRLLMMPDLFHWLLTGQKSNEFTNATTTQFFDSAAQHWAVDLLEELDLPTKLLEPVSLPGTRLGPLLPEVAEATGLSTIEVVLPGTHDTASAVMAVPASDETSARPRWCYISSGTWSLMGVELPTPIINDRCRDLNFTNEGGVGGTIRLLRNIAGLWLVQECRRLWNEAGKNYQWDDLNRLTDAARPLVSLVNPDDSRFVAPANMPEAIRDYCRQSGQAVPADEGAILRCALDSLALRYRQVLGWLEELVGGRIETIHVVGGGAQNRQLCQATADACQRPVVAGPIEATALGNLLVQAMAAGEVGSIRQARELVRLSFPVERYEPRESATWDEAYTRFLTLPCR